MSQDAPARPLKTFYPYLLYNTRGHFIGFTPYRPQPEGRRTQYRKRVSLLSFLRGLLHL